MDAMTNPGEVAQKLLAIAARLEVDNPGVVGDNPVRKRIETIRQKAALHDPRAVVNV